MEFLMATSGNSASAYGAQMAKYFTMNQPPHVAIDSLDSVVRPQLAMTRLIARSGIPERTASIPSERAYVVSVHLNPAGKGEWELWTDGKHIKTGPWPTGGVAMCDLESDSSIETQVQSTGFISTSHERPWTHSLTMKKCPELNGSFAFTELLIRRCIT
jgi:hypothetical protein